MNFVYNKIFDFENFQTILLHVRKILLIYFSIPKFSLIFCLIMLKILPKFRLCIIAKFQNLIDYFIFDHKIF